MHFSGAPAARKLIFLHIFCTVKYSKNHQITEKKTKFTRKALNIYFSESFTVEKYSLLFLYITSNYCILCEHICLRMENCLPICKVFKIT